jgi:hypothetical protein
MNTEQVNATQPPATFPPTMCRDAKEVLDEWIRCDGMRAVARCYVESPRWLRGKVDTLNAATNQWVSETRAEGVLRVIERVEHISAFIGHDLDQEDMDVRILSDDTADREEADPSVRVPYLTSRQILDAVRADATASLAEGAALDSLRAAKAALKAARQKTPGASAKA